MYVMCVLACFTSIIVLTQFDHVTLYQPQDMRLDSLPSGQDSNSITVLELMGS